MTELDEQLMKEMILASRFIMRPHGRPMVQEDIIRKLSNGPISQKDLQEEMHVRPGTISETVSKLEEKGYLNRNRSEEDGRAVCLELTERGREKLQTLKEKEDLFSTLSETEKENLKEILTKLNNDWIRRDPMPPMEGHPPMPPRGDHPPMPPFKHHPHGGFHHPEESFEDHPPFDDPFDPER